MAELTTDDGSTASPEAIRRFEERNNAVTDQTTDHLSGAVEAFREEVYQGPGRLLLNRTMVRRGLRAAESHFATYYEDKFRARWAHGGEPDTSPGDVIAAEPVTAPKASGTRPTTSPKEEPMSDRKDNVIVCPNCGRKVRQGNMPRHLGACRSGRAAMPKERVSPIAARRFGGEL